MDDYEAMANKILSIGNIFDPNEEQFRIFKLKCQDEIFVQELSTIHIDDIVSKLLKDNAINSVFVAELYLIKRMDLVKYFTEYCGRTIDLSFNVEKKYDEDVLDFLLSLNTGSIYGEFILNNLTSQTAATIFLKNGITFESMLEYIITMTCSYINNASITLLITDDTDPNAIIIFYEKVFPWNFYFKISDLILALDSGANVDKIFSKMFGDVSTDIVDYLFNSGLSINKNILHIAFQKSNVNVLIGLLDRGITIDDEDYSYMINSKCDLTEIFTVLLDRCIDPITLIDKYDFISYELLKVLQNYDLNWNDIIASMLNKHQPK